MYPKQRTFLYFANELVTTHMHVDLLHFNLRGSGPYQSFGGSGAEHKW